MPVAIYSTPTSAGSATAVTSLDVSRPTGNNGQILLIAAIAVRGGSGVTVTPPAGWTLLDRTDSSTTVALAIYRKFVNLSDEGASYTFTFTSGIVAGSIFAFSGADPRNLVPAISGTADTTPAGTLDAPSITPGVSNTLLLAIFANSNGTRTYSAPTGMTERLDVGFGVTTGTRLGINTQSITSGAATGTRTTNVAGTVTGVGTAMAIAPDLYPNRFFMVL